MYQFYLIQVHVPVLLNTGTVKLVHVHVLSKTVLSKTVLSKTDTCIK
jgi:hypothetical protein